jgi:Spy/CpxP family protein refolding chaperone
MAFMISFRALSTVSILGLLVTVAGCSAESATASGADTASAARAADTVVADQAASDQGPARGPRPGGPDFLLVAALHEPLNLTPAQKATIEGALAANKPSAPPSFDKTRVSALAAGIRAGKVDATAIKPPSEDGFAAHQAASARALATLHATLTPEQRTALVAAVAKRGEQGGHKDFGKDGARPPHMEHGGPPPGGGAMGPMGPIGHMLEGLDLTKAQEDAIKAKLEAQRPAAPSEADRAAMKAQHESMRTAMQAKLQTFASDSFDATAFVTPPQGMMKPAADHAERFAADLTFITSILDAGQREKLAARIEAGPPARVGRPVPGAKLQQGVTPQ